jgi:hypothetical protein
LSEGFSGKHRGAVVSISFILIGIQAPEKYNENFDVLSEGPSSGTLVPEVYFYYFHCEGERENKPLVGSGN